MDAKGNFRSGTPASGMARSSRWSSSFSLCVEFNRHRNKLKLELQHKYAGAETGVPLRGSQKET
jgi:hypothetical protein